MIVEIAMGPNPNVLSSDSKFNIHEVKADVPWGILTAKCWGDPCSKPVLVVHGIQDNAGSFDRLIPMLPTSFYYVCLELPGHGKSTRIPKGIELTAMLYISAIHRFVRHLSWSRFYYLGHSLGGQLGIYYAAMYPEQIIKIITLDTLPMFSVQLDEFLDHYTGMTEKLLKLEEKLSNSSPPNYTYEEAVQKLMNQRPSPITREAAEALVKRMLKPGKTGFYYSTDQRLKYGVRIPMTLQQNIRNVSKVVCPYLNIMSKITYSACESESMDGKAKPILKTFEGMKNFEIVIVDGFHDVHNNEPEVVAPHISKFLTNTKSSL